jgi:hypothetical protein
VQVLALLLVFVTALVATLLLALMRGLRLRCPLMVPLLNIALLARDLFVG